MKRHRSLLAPLLLALSALSQAATYGAMVRVATIYLAPDAKSSKLAEISRGQEVILIETSREWIHIEAELGPEKTMTGWILNKGAVFNNTPNGDKILFGEAVDSEDQASRRHGRKGAAQDAMRLYYHASGYFPTSPLAGEALYRAADIRWQIDRDDIFSRPSAREKDPGLREPIDDEWMKQVMKKFPGTKWADLAAFHLLDNKICGDWQGASKCPEKETDLYEKYANEHPQSPSAPEAVYQAAWRQSALVEIYKTEDKMGKSGDAKKRAIEICQRLLDKYGQSDYAPRAHRLLYLLQQDIPTYGNEVN